MAQRVSKMGIGLFVSRLHWTVSSACLNKYFSRFGDVLFAEVKIDNKTGLHRGFGWVRMSNDRDVQKVLWLKQHIIDGYDFDVNIDKKEAHKLDELRNMDATDTLETNTSESTPPTDLKF